MKVLIIQQVMKQYRGPLFRHLHERLASENIELTVVYSTPSGEQQEKGDNIALGSACGGVEVPIVSFFGGRVVFQQCLKQIWTADLVVVEQANKHVLNYLLMALSFFKLKKFAFWGHGHNLQSDSNTWKEKIKKQLINTPDWWFAYTEMTAKYVESCGVEKKEITNLNNSIDMTDFFEQLASISAGEVDEQKRSLHISQEASVGLYCGAMYEEKRIGFLLAALEEVKSKNNAFFFIFCGRGIDDGLVRDFCEKHNWCHYAGAVFGRQKALFFKMANIVLNPGLVGLGILDCFAAGVPMITTDYPKHSPEISYLKNNGNGLMVKEDIHCYTQAVLEILADEEKLKGLSKGALASSRQFSIEDMASNFADGISQALVKEV